jgi:DNA-directed RNA polymerase subunit omega
MNEDNSLALSQIEPEALPSEDTKPPDMPFFIPNDEERGVYRFILAAAKRARQLQSGARPTISTTSRKPTRIAMEEIRQGAVEVEILPDDWVEPEKEPIGAVAAADGAGEKPQG